MSVFTTVTPEALSSWLRGYSIGELVELKGIAEGVTNTNYQLVTTQGRYVLTLFETLTAEDLPYYVNLMVHLARHGIASAAPIANLRDEYIDTLCGRPSIVVNWLNGKPVEHPDEVQCHALGAMLAQMHRAGETYPARMHNPRGPKWWRMTAEHLYSDLPEETRELLRHELHEQARHRYAHLPTGVIHADLFRDNVLMDGERIGGFIDFYYACNDLLSFDLAITVNDWCALPDGEIDPVRAKALCAGYQSVRPLNADERQAWPLVLRSAAIRFYVSRLLDWYRPASGELTWKKDPEVFGRILRAHIQRDVAATLSWLDD
ncbi:homoserine kinase [Burkholderiaceae bacterium DAT-1]|nr:homoserine kinase [Burkholderiaceae bacterium DAT-1]